MRVIDGGIRDKRIYGGYHDRKERGWWWEGARGSYKIMEGVGDWDEVEGESKGALNHYKIGRLFITFRHYVKRKG